MRITANGRELEVGQGITLSEFIRSRDLDPRYVVVERNGDPVERSRYGDLVLADGDRLELVRAVAGGS